MCKGCEYGPTTLRGRRQSAGRGSPHPREVVEAILDGRFKPTYWAQQMLPMHLYTTYYPQLADERRKRAHRKTYRAHLEALPRQRSSPPNAPRGLGPAEAASRIDAVAWGHGPALHFPPISTPPRTLPPTWRR